jgi:hypothetical protein
MKTLTAKTLSKWTPNSGRCSAAPSRRSALLASTAFRLRRTACLSMSSERSIPHTLPADARLAASAMASPGPKPISSTNPKTPCAAERGPSAKHKHHHRERNHQGLDNNLIVANDAVNGTGKIVHRERLGVAVADQTDPLSMDDGVAAPLAACHNGGMLLTDAWESVARGAAQDPADRLLVGGALMHFAPLVRASCNSTSHRRGPAWVGA